MLKYILASLVALIITGCATVETKVVTKTKYVAVKFDSYLLRQCDISTPPNKEEFLKLKAPQQRNALALYSVDLHTNLSNCNDRFKELGEIQDKLAKQVESKNEE